MAKKRAMITVDAEKWDSLQQELKDRGYPPNSMSFYLDSCLDRLECHLTGEPYDDFPATLLLEIHAKGMREALKSTSMELVETDEDRERLGIKTKTVD